MLCALSIVVTSTVAGPRVIVAAVVITVFVAYLPGGVEGAIEVAPGDSVGIVSADTSHHLDAVLGEDAGGPFEKTFSANVHCLRMLL